MARLGILCGGGALPASLVRHCRETNRPYFVLAFEGHTDPAFLSDSVPHAWVRLGAIGSSLELLRREGVDELVMVGAIRRPSLAELRPDAWTAAFFARNSANILGDDGLAKALRRALEAEGFRLLGIDELFTDLLAPLGAVGTLLPDARDLSDIVRGFAVIDALGALDIGQAAAIQDGTVLSVEGVEGTDAMVARSGNLKAPGRGPVLVKASKPGQERRIDLPTIGPATVETAAAAGFAGIAVEAGRALIVERERMAALADELGLFVVGHPRAAPPLIYLIAGEPSGDLLGARLMAALKARTGGAVRFAGIGGSEMRGEGLDSLLPISGLAIMGVLEVIPSALRILRWVRQTAEDIETRRPDAVVTIDSSGFCFRVAERLRKKPKPPLIIHYVAPMVWAWRAHRVHHAKGAADHLMALLPFEPPYFEKVGLPTSFVGHPVIEAEPGDGAGFRRRHDIPEAAPILALLPGSRSAEVKRLLPIFTATARLLKARIADLVIIAPTVENVEQTVREGLADSGLPVIVLSNPEEKRGAFAASTVALAASGTVSLELAVAGVPTVISYRIAALTAFALRYVMKVPVISLVNILTKRTVIPEILQDQATPENLAGALETLVLDPAARAAQLAGFAEALAMLRPGDARPSDTAAETVLDLIQRRRSSVAP